MNARSLVVVALLAAIPAPAFAATEDWIAQGRQALDRAKRLEGSPRAKNVILFVGDGMGVSTVTAARILEGQRRGDPGEENHLSFERLPHLALVKTYNTNQQTPDSAGTMTAMTTGVKTRAGVIGVDETVPRGEYAAVAGHELRTFVEQAEEHGLSTGIVTTTTVTHATPAACYAHSADRAWQSDGRLPEAARRAGFADMARQLVELPDGDGIDVVLGGGRRHFRPASASDPEYPEQTGARVDGRDLAAEWAARPRSASVWNLDQLRAVDLGATDRLLGLFEPEHMNYEVDRAGDGAGEPSLSEMTAAALDILSRNDRGYVLVVEGGRIDHGHHSGNAYRALTETIEFSNAVRTALERTDPGETLVIVTADHGHVFTIGGYPTRGNPILGKVVENDERGAPMAELAADALGLPYTTLGYQNGPGFFSPVFDRGEDGVHHDDTSGQRRGGMRMRPDLSEVATDHPDYIQEAAVPLRYETHTAEDVAVYAGGPGAQWIHGVQEQSYLYYVITEALGWNDEPGWFSRLFR